MQKLQLKSKLNTPFISECGAFHKEATIVVSQITNNILDKELQISFLLFNSLNDLSNKPIDNSLFLVFTENGKSTQYHPETNEVIEWGSPSYSEVFELFQIEENGIVLNSQTAIDWFLEKVSFQDKSIGTNFEFFI